MNVEELNLKYNIKGTGIEFIIFHLCSEIDTNLRLYLKLNLEI